ncbi:MAG: hypothetical protein A2729_02625 [Candidatus Buchananbacteria bacterium RIFCSPHIGHO2_01_FULL_39_14]|uniref:Cell division protein FtsX n=1 Tax=Candidatus Buchananbacteria bacterium RIFCSPHIGHO2_01_FULL_39_14 TaxID=1797532 RepID=A0A1G1XS75_9BACT|nr:MAG: hypothetical protein A2729_02625 [Candidatus Buchananbacteria bacterium RIFCSPHIGHO2_01_FULL_39_14]OGY48902.1 MAG: hypothetical protein A3D39_01275 [Candidatus Buchananbacteria bacterium RIFCSPHIGHO2_02_FULL_39_17]
MFMASPYRILTFAWQSFWRNIWLSLVTITIIVLTFISINFLVVINFITDAAIKVLQEKVDISINFKPDVLEPQVQEIQTYLSALTQVKEINYISQKEALENFRQTHSANQLVIDSLAELENNPLGASLQIKAKNLDDYSEIITVINNSKYNNLIAVKNFDDNQLYISKTKNVSEYVKKIAVFASGFFILVAFLIVFNTIRVAIYTHRQEIGVMKLVGATNWFIRGPFIVEAIFYGVIACILAILIIYPFLNFLQPYLVKFYLTEDFNIINYFNENFWQIFGLELLVIIALTIVGSIIAIRRYLKV